MIRFFLFAFILLSASASAQTGLSFLKIGTTAREQAMGNVGVASAKGASANYYNSAMLISEKSDVLFSQNVWLFDTQSSYAAGAFQFEKSAIGVSFTWLSVKDIPIRSRPTTDPDGFFSSQNGALSASYARKFSNKLTLAVTGKFLYEKLFVDEATGFAADFSAVYLPPIQNLILAATIQNLGSMSELSKVSSPLPKTFRAGGAYTFSLSESSILLEGNLESVFSNQSHFNFGAEYRFNNLVWVRAGYTIGNESRSISAGFGIKYQSLRFDYAFVPFSNELGSANLLTLNFQY